MSKFNYENENELRIGNSLCEFCVHYNSENPTVCKNYPEKIPENILKSDIVCSFLKKKNQIEL